MELQKEKLQHGERKTEEYYVRCKRREEKKGKDTNIIQQNKSTTQRVISEEKTIKIKKTLTESTSSQQSLQKFEILLTNEFNTLKDIKFVPKRPLNLKPEIIKQIELKTVEIDVQFSITKPKKLEELNIRLNILSPIKLSIAKIETDVPKLKLNKSEPFVLLPLIKRPPILKASNINLNISLNKEKVTPYDIDAFIDLVEEKEEFVEKDNEIRSFMNITLSGKPLVLFLFEPERENIVYVFEQLFKHIYREKEGGKPESLIISISEDDKEEFINEIRWIKAEDRILTLRFESLKVFTEVFGNKKLIKRLSNRINQLFSQNFGVIIFDIVVKNDENIKEDNIEKILTEEIRFLTRRSIEIKLISFVDSFKLSKDPFIYSFIKVLKSDKDKLKLIKKLTGVNITNNSTMLKSFGNLFEDALRKREEILHRLKRIKGGLYYLLTRPHKDKESEEHRLYKVAVVYHLVKKLSKEISKKDLTYEDLSKKIKSEEKIDNKVIPDVYFEEEIGKGIAFEIETFFGEDREGKDIIDKLRYTLEKYRGIANVKKICLVIDPLSFFLHKKEIINTVKIIGKSLKNEGKEIEILLPCINCSNRLCELRKVYKY